MRGALILPLKHLARRLLPQSAVEVARRLWRRSSALDPRRFRRLASFRRHNAGAHEDEIFLRDGLRLGIDPRSREPFEWYAFSSPDGAAELDAFLARMSGRGRLLDVGASHGLFSLVFTQGREGSRALAVEPSPTALEVLEANLARNPACDVVPLQIAAGAEAGEVRMRQVWHHFEALPPTEGDTGAHVVPMRPLDALCEEHDFVPDLVKVDVEGYELAVLEGSRRLLERSRPPIFLEVHPRHLARLGRSVNELFESLSAAGYHPFTYRGAALSPARLARIDVAFHVLCLAEDDAGRGRPGAG